MQKENLQTRTKKALVRIGEKIFLDRYAVKDIQREHWPSATRLWFG